MSRNLEDLDPKIRDRAKKALQEMKESAHLKWLGVSGFLVSETKRDVAVQMAYYARGRMSVGDVQAMYHAAGLYALTEKEARTMNTWTLESKHLKGLAIDIVPLNKAGACWWNAPEEVWTTMGKIGEEAGLAWGGRWKTKDCPHFEYKE